MKLNRIYSFYSLKWKHYKEKKPQNYTLERKVVELIIKCDNISLKVSPTLSGSCKSDGVAGKVISQCGYVFNIATFMILGKNIEQERLNLYRIDIIRQIWRVS